MNRKLYLMLNQSLRMSGRWKNCQKIEKGLTGYNFLCNVQLDI